MGPIVPLVTRGTTRDFAWSSTIAGVAQPVELLFCKQEVRGSSPLTSSGGGPRVKDGAKKSWTFPRRSVQAEAVSSTEGCPSGQREQAVNLPAYAYGGSNPPPSTLARPVRPSLVRPQPLVQWQRDSEGAIRRVPRAGVAQLVERQPSKLNVAGSNPVSRSGRFRGVCLRSRHPRLTPAHLAQMVERVLGKDEVTSSILVVGSKRPAEFRSLSNT